MTEGVIQRCYKPVPDWEVKLAKSKAGAEHLELRHVVCPFCSYPLLEVYGREHHYTRVKCRKCKFNDVIDTALFRTMHLSRRNNSLLNKHQRYYR